MAKTLGVMKSAETYCGLHYDPDGIDSQIIRYNDDMRIYGWFEQYEREALEKQATMAPEIRAKYCADIEQKARELKIIQ